MRSSQQETSDGSAIVEPNKPAPHFELGRRGETLAIEHLERAGYRIVAANFRLPIGRNTRDVIVNAEIDVVTVVSPSARHIDPEPRIELLKNYWTDEKLRQRNWREARWD